MSKNGGLPPGWRELKLGEILELDEIRVVVRILKTAHDERTRMERIKEFFNRRDVKKKLLAKEILPDYLAYQLYFLYISGKLPI